MRPVLRDSLPENATAAGGARIDIWPTLLVVDDDPQMLQTLVCYFEKRGFHVAPASSLAEAKLFFHRRTSWTLIISDFHLPDGTGGELWNWVREQSIAMPPFLLMSGSFEGEMLCAGVDFLPKPFALEELENRVRTLLRGKHG